MRLVEETQAHVLIGLLSGLLLLLLSGSGLTSTTGGRGGGSGGTARRNGSELLSTLSDQLFWSNSSVCSFFHKIFFAIETNLVDVLALELRDELLETLLIGVDTDGGEDTLDIVGGGGLVASEGDQEVSCEVLHFE